MSGYNRLHSRRNYWEEQSDVQNSLVAQNIQRNTFEAFLQYLHVADHDNLITIQQCSLRGIPIVRTLRADTIQDAPISNKKTMGKKSRGAFEVAHCSLDKAETCVVSWKDNGVVIMGSNCYGANPIAQAKRWNRIEKKEELLDMPSAIHKYNKCMDGSDH